MGGRSLIVVDPGATGKRACVLKSSRARLVRDDLFLAPGSRQRRPGVALASDSKTYTELPLAFYSNLRFSDPSRVVRTKTLVILYDQVVVIRSRRHFSRPDMLLDEYELETQCLDTMLNHRDGANLNNDRGSSS